MSAQLEAKIEEVERKREELAETIRRVGDAFATGLDRHGVVELAVRQAVDACDAEAAARFRSRTARSTRCEVGAVDRGARAGDRGGRARGLRDQRRTSAPELLGALEGDEGAERTRRAVSPHGRRARTPSRSGSARSWTGPSTSARSRSPGTAPPFTREEEELLEYLAGQAVVSIENASLHETVERQAVTDELTGLANMRAFTSIAGPRDRAQPPLRHPARRW